ncbi:hypothetical protein C1645_732716 [Glomus cerebriforme]|uniref:Uncharacterized protein n=1 Tax=Glomus cerebriforme TaxID=658196 RepID=A0A397TFU5_9GLOM|nr:hypothetical protein C1645_732716 [Glomus cerebriforme]
MTAVLRSTNYLSFKIPNEKDVHEYFKKVEARYWQLKHYLNFHLRTDEEILPWNTVYSKWQQSLLFISKDYVKKVPGCVSSFCKDLYNICDTFEGSIVRDSCEEFYNEFYQRNLDLQIAERIWQLDSTVFSTLKISEVLQVTQNKKRSMEYNEAESSSGKRTRHKHEFASESELGCT